VTNVYFLMAGLWPRLHGYGPAGMPIDVTLPNR